MTTFADELNTWGPDRPPAAPLSQSEAERYCRRLATAHYENFPVVSCFLPRSLHQHFYNVYAFCRWADDLADELHDTQRSLTLLEWWRQQLDACFAGRADHPVFIALSGTICAFAIPPQPFEDLISAFVQDQTVHEYATFDDLSDYCRRSANPVGRLVLYLCRQAQPQNFGWSDSVCTGLQLANFWQDVRRDLAIGRIYLPREDCDRFGYRRDDLQAAVTNDAFLNLMRFEVDRARTLLDPARNGALEHLRSFPLRMQVDIELFARGGLKILDRIERIGYRVWERRPVVTKLDFARLLAGCTTRVVARNLLKSPVTSRTERPD